MTDKLEALKAAALAATPGPWYRSSVMFNGITSEQTFMTQGNKPHIANAGEKRDAIFIAAASPDVVLSLLAALEDKDQQLARYSMSAGQADQRLCESRAVRIALSFGEDAIDVAPTDLVEAIQVIRRRAEEAEQRLQQPAFADVMAERQRQISAEGWTPEHDDQHASSEMAGAAACYARHVNARGWVYSHNPDDYQCEPESCNWPWDASWWKPTNPRRDLVKAGALILAEIERLDRASAKVEGG